MSTDFPPSDERGVGAIVKHDLPASIVLFLVALPLCMGIALASGVPIAAGLVTGIVGGIVVGMIAGAPLQVSGPAAGLTVIVYEIVRDHGLPVLGAAVLVAGLFQVVAGLLRLGQWFRAVSPAVIKGMLSGIGVLILASQFHVMIDDKPRGSAVDNLVTIPEAVAKGAPLPTLGEREERELRTNLLHRIGQLHESQEEVHERIAEHFAEEMTAEEKALEAELLAQYEDEQNRIRDELAEIDELVHQSGILATNVEGVQTATDEALRKVEAALADVHIRNVEEAVESQRVAAESLSALNGELKNHDWAAKLGVATILLIVLWQAFAAKGLPFIPAPLVAIVAVTAVAGILHLPVLYVEVPENLGHAIHLISWTPLKDIAFGTLIQFGLLLAVVASAETLLCATAVDQMHRGPRTKYDRELFAQGVGNTICGILGALPMTGVIVRSAANVQAGGRSRLSAILHGIWLLIFVALLGHLLTIIPTAALAGILVYTGWKLINFKAIRELAEYGWSEVAIYLITIVAIVGTDLLTGVLVGIALSAVKLLYTFSHLEANLETHPADPNIKVLHLDGAATFVRLPVLAAALEDVPPDAELHVELQGLSYIDHACLDLLMNWAKQHEALGGRLVIDWESLKANFRDAGRGNGNTRRPTAAAPETRAAAPEPAHRP